MKNYIYNKNEEAPIVLKINIDIHEKIRTIGNKMKSGELEHRSENCKI